MAAKASPSSWQLGSPDDTLVPVLRCACGATFRSWDCTISQEPDSVTEMPCCGRQVTFVQRLSVVTRHDDGTFSEDRVGPDVRPGAGWCPGCGHEAHGPGACQSRVDVTSASDVGRRWWRCACQGVAIQEGRDG